MSKALLFFDVSTAQSCGQAERSPVDRVDCEGLWVCVGSGSRLAPLFAEASLPARCKQSREAGCAAITRS
jgi:hypothetical protein